MDLAPPELVGEHLLQQGGVVEVGANGLDLVAVEVGDDCGTQHELVAVGLDSYFLVDHERTGEGGCDAELGQAPVPEDVQGVDLDIDVGERRLAVSEGLGQVRETRSPACSATTRSRRP